MKRVPVDVIVEVDDDVTDETVVDNVEQLVTHILEADGHHSVDVWSDAVSTSTDEKIALSLSRVTDIDKDMVNSIVATAKTHE